METLNNVTYIGKDGKQAKGTVQVVKKGDEVGFRLTKFTAKEIDDFVQAATKNPDAKKVMLGSWDDGLPTSYIQRAGKDYTYFDMGSKWDEVKKLVDNDIDDLWKEEMWKINKQFIDEQKSLGKEFFFSHEPWKAQTKTFLSKEAEYLIDLGATNFLKINDNTWKVIW